MLKNLGIIIISSSFKMNSDLKSLDLSKYEKKQMKYPDMDYYTLPNLYQIINLLMKLIYVYIISTKHN